MRTRFYFIASNFEMTKEVERLDWELTRLRYVVRPKWWECDTKKLFGHLPEKEWYRHHLVLEWHARDQHEITRCDHFIILFPNQGDLVGALIELGFAKAKGKHIIGIGKPKRRSLWFLIDSVDAFLKDVKRKYVAVQD